MEACHELLPWLIPQLDRFPRARRFTLGERLETALLDVLGHSWRGRTGARDRRRWGAATCASSSPGICVCLSHELQVISTRRYAHGAKLMEMLGRQVGGWLKASVSP